MKRKLGGMMIKGNDESITACEMRGNCSSETQHMKE